MAMAQVDGIVKESLPNAKFRVELVATKAVIVCSTSGKMRKNFVRVLVGDPVKVGRSCPFGAACRLDPWTHLQDRH